MKFWINIIWLVYRHVHVCTFASEVASGEGVTGDVVLDIDFLKYLAFASGFCRKWAIFLLVSSAFSLWDFPIELSMTFCVDGWLSSILDFCFVPLVLLPFCVFLIDGPSAVFLIDGFSAVSGSSTGNSADIYGTLAVSGNSSTSNSRQSKKLTWG